MWDFWGYCTFLVVKLSRKVMFSYLYRSFRLISGTSRSWCYNSDNYIHRSFCLLSKFLAMRAALCMIHWIFMVTCQWLLSQFGKQQFWGGKTFKSFWTYVWKVTPFYLVNSVLSSCETFCKVCRWQGSSLMKYLFRYFKLKWRNKGLCEFVNVFRWDSLRTFSALPQASCNLLGYGPGIPSVSCLWGQQDTSYLNIKL